MCLVLSGKKTGSFPCSANGHCDSSVSDCLSFVLRGLMEVWKALLEKTEEISKRRLTISELLITQVSDIMKQQKRIKESKFKRVRICFHNFLS